VKNPVSSNFAFSNFNVYRYAAGNATAVDRASQWWAHRYTHNLAQLKYGFASVVGRCTS
jgi:hypothetical protein